MTYLPTVWWLGIGANFLLPTSELHTAQCFRKPPCTIQQHAVTPANNRIFTSWDLKGQKHILVNHVNFGSTILNCFCSQLELPCSIQWGGVLPWWESKGNPSNASPPQKKNALLRGYQPWLAFNNPSNMAFSSWWWNNPLANWIISPRNGGQKKFQKLFWSENNLVTCVAEGYPYLEDHPI